MALIPAFAGRIKKGDFTEKGSKTLDTIFNRVKIALSSQLSASTDTDTPTDTLR